MKVLQINSTLNWGSTGRIAEDIGKVIIEEGGESYTAYRRYANSTQSQSIRIGNKWDIYNHVLQTRLFDRHGLYSKKATKIFIEKIKEMNPDIIHLHNIHGYYLNYQLLFRYLSNQNIPIIWTLHDCWSFTGHCAYYSYAQCERWKTGCYDCPQKKQYPASYLVNRSKQNFIDKKNAFTSIKNMTIVAVSNWLANEVKQSFLKNYPIKVIHNGINLNVFKPTHTKNTLNLDNKFIVLGVASVWENRKGLNDFFKLRTLLSSDFSIILIGLNEKQIKSLPKGIIGIKRTNSVTELAEYYSCADVYINFSVEESLGLTTCEAMACGTPVIVYNCTACPEVVSNDTGFVVEQGDLEGVISAINQIKSVGKISYKQACRERAVKHFNKEDRYNEYIQLYNSLLK